MKGRIKEINHEENEYRNIKNKEYCSLQSNLEQMLRFNVNKKLSVDCIRKIISMNIFYHYVGVDGAYLEVKGGQTW